MQKQEYTQRLCIYIGQIELKAFTSKSDDQRYGCFCDALASLDNGQDIDKETLSLQEKQLAKSYLELRVSETEPKDKDKIIGKKEGTEEQK